MPTPPYQQKAPPTKPDERHEIMPTLFGDGYGLYEVRKESFVASFVINTVILALLIWLGTWTATHAPEIKKVVTGESVDISPYIMEKSKTVAGGGGGGGSHDVNPASKGALPKFSKEQFAPPSVTPPDQAKLTVAPTVVVPPEIKMAQGPVIGDPLGKLNSIPSNGVGIGGGIGSGSGGGVGSGHGPGVGPGHGGGIGGGAYHVGGGVSAPHVLFKPIPEFSDEARRNKYQGKVILRGVVGVDGRLHEVSVVHSLGMGLDEEALKSVPEYRFEPGRKDGAPVPVEVFLEINFSLY
jgi:TonB family protein